MSKSILLFALVALSCAQFLPGESPKVGNPLPFTYVDTKRMAGTWYVAYNFNSAIKNGAANVTVNPTVSCWTVDITEDHDIVKATWSVNVNGTVTNTTQEWAASSRGNVWFTNEPVGWELTWVAVEPTQYSWALGAADQFQHAVLLSRTTAPPSAAVLTVATTVLSEEGYALLPTNQWTFDNTGCSSTQVSI